MERIINDAIDYFDRNNNILWDMAHDYIESEVSLQRKINEESPKRRERYSSNRESEKHTNLRSMQNNFKNWMGN